MSQPRVILIRQAGGVRLLRQNLAGPQGPNRISDATAAGSLTAVGDAVTVLVLNAAGTLVRRLTATAGDIGKVLGVSDDGAGNPVLGWVAAGTAPAYSPGLDFSDSRNSMYSGSVV